MSNDAAPPTSATADPKTRLRASLKAAFQQERERQKVKNGSSATADQLERVWQSLVNRLAMDLEFRENICAETAAANSASGSVPASDQARPNFTLAHGGWINEWLDEQAQEIAGRFCSGQTNSSDAELHRLRRRLLDVRVGPSTFIKNARDFRTGHALTPQERESREINRHLPQVQNVFLVPPPGVAGREFALDDFCRSVADGTADDGVLVVTGVRGSGKSTLLNRVELFCNNWQAGEHRPFYLRFDLGCHFGPRFLLNLLEALARSAYDHCRRPPFGRAGESAPTHHGWWSRFCAACPRSYVGVVGRTGRWCSGNLRWALLMLMVGWLAVATLLLAERPSDPVVQARGLLGSLIALEKKMSDSSATDQARAFADLKHIFLTLGRHEERFRREQWLAPSLPLSTNASLVAAGFQRSVPVVTTNVSPAVLRQIFSNDWEFFVFNATSAVPVRWVTNFSATNALAFLRQYETNQAATNLVATNALQARSTLAQGLRGLAAQLQPLTSSPDNGALPSLTLEDQGKYYVLAFALLAVVAVGFSHNLYRRAVFQVSTPALPAALQKFRTLLLGLLLALVGAAAAVSIPALWLLPDRWAYTRCPFGVMVLLILGGVLGAVVCAWNHRLAPRDETRAATDLPWLRDAMMILCLLWFFTALISTFLIWENPLRRTCGMMAIGGGIAVAALCIAQSWLPAWWDFKFRCYDLLTQLGQRSDKEPGDLPLVGQLAALAKMFLPVGVAGPDYQTMETPFLEQELKRLLHDCRVHFGRVIVLIDDIDVLPGEKHPELLRILRPVSKVRGATFLIAAPLHFFHLYRYASLNDVQSTVQNVIVMGDPQLFTSASGKEPPFQPKIGTLENSLQQLLAANMRIPCASHALPPFVQDLAACWVKDENKKRVEDELERCGASKRELLRELDRMLSNPGRQPFQDRASSVDQKHWVDEAKARFSAAEREANPDFRPEEKPAPPASPLDGWTFQLQVSPVKKNLERPALDC